MARAVSARLSAREGRQFGLTVGGAFVLLAAVLWWRGAQTPSLAAVGLGTALVLGGLLVPTRLRPVQAGWMRMAHLISRVTTPVFLGVVYFGVILPIGGVMRLMGRNPLVHRPGGDGYWIDRAREADRRGTMRQQF